ncbi:aminodeoxychorismate synthase component I [Rhodoferax sp. PAMC 29310]|uniref:aminodeoxychorismate synthase component I n=1 Tax=Rhodoferax sp. PAMC 29310 TaxID=2822760 RepID=UPI001B31F08C|nr:aminodeoxychorismate synthase component I [Rhodoferax sp. PAMC 29310]
MRFLIDFCAPQSDPTAALRCAFGTPLEVLVAHQLDEVLPLLDRVDALARSGLWCVGYVAYEAAPAFDPALITHAPIGPLAWFGVHEKPLPWPIEPAAGSVEVQWHNPLSRPSFDAAMASIHDAIGAGEFYQVNYTARLHGNFQGKPTALFAALQRAQPNGYAAYLDTGSEHILSVSPELFFDWHDDQILVRPMKGTAPRGASAADDETLAGKLRSTPKELAENVMIVDLLRNDVSRIATPFSVKTPRLFQVETLPTVLQMVSDVAATTRPNTSLTDVFAALFPCGSITGAPKVRAMQMIKDLEPEARGVYCGAMGVVRPGGHATFNVGIRTVTLKGPAALCGIGSGITFDATADAEWNEWRLKRGFLERASQPFNLLETLCLDNGQLRHAPAHLARLARAAAHFGYPLDATQLKKQLNQLATSHPSGAWRVRAQLRRDGQVLTEAFALGPTLSPVLLQLADTAFEEADSEFVRFKTTHRPHYDAYAPSQSGVFDTLLWNTRGEITECTRGNIALQLDGVWVTPPLSCGLLDGVGRAQCLFEGRLVEAMVRLDDLPRVSALAFVNSLRGWVDAELLPKS